MLETSPGFFPRVARRLAIYPLSFQQALLRQERDGKFYFGKSSLASSAFDQNFLEMPALEAHLRLDIEAGEDSVDANAMFQTRALCILVGRAHEAHKAAREP